MIFKVIIWIWLAMGVGASMAKHGQPKEGRENAWYGIFAFIIFGWLVWMI